MCFLKGIPTNKYLYPTNKFQIKFEMNSNYWLAKF